MAVRLMKEGLLEAGRLGNTSSSHSGARALIFGRSGLHPSFMLGLTVKELARATLFVPFAIQMNDGRVFKIDHPDYVVVSPKGGRVIVYDRDERETHLCEAGESVIQKQLPTKDTKDPKGTKASPISISWLWCGSWG